MRKLPTHSQLMSMEDEPSDGSQGDMHKNKSSSNKPLDPKAKSNRSEKSMNSSSSKEMSPARQIMKAVTKYALDSKKKSVKKSTKTKGENQEPGDRASSETQSAQGKIKSPGNKLKTKV